VWAEVSVPFLAWDDRNPPYDEPAPSTNATLGALTTNVAALQPRLQESARTYAIVLPSTQRVHTLTAVDTHSSATMSVNGNGGGEGRSVLTIPVAEGDSVTSMVTVTTEDGVTTETYTDSAKRYAASSDAPMGFWFAPDDGRIVLGFAPPSMNVLHVEVQLGDGPWTAFQPAVTLAPVLLDGMPNGTPVTVWIRFVMPEGVTTASVPLAMTPNSGRPPHLATSSGTAATEDVLLDGRTLTFDVAITVTNASEHTFHHAWLAPSLRGGDIVDVRPSGNRRDDPSRW